MKRPVVDPVRQAFRKRLSYVELSPAQKKGIKIDQIKGINLFEPCYVVFNKVVWDLNIMIECNPDYIPKGWDGRKGDVAFKNSEDRADEVVMAMILR